MRIVFYISICWLVNPFHLFGQNVPIVQSLPEFTIESQRLSFDSNDFEKLVKPDSAWSKIYSQQNIHQWLSMEGISFVRNYGVSNLATISLRGGNAAQTAVVIDGINVNNPMNGQTDFNTIPLFFFNDIYLIAGGNAASWGSGAVTGTIHLNQNTGKDSVASISLTQDFNSLQNYTAGLKTTLVKPSLKISSNVLWQFQTNRFSLSHYDIDTAIEAPARQKGLNFSIVGNIKTHWTIIAKIYAVDLKSKLAPTLNLTDTGQYQNTGFVLSYMRFMRQKNKRKWVQTLAHNYQSIDYFDKKIGLESDNSVNFILYEHEYSIPVKSWHLSGGLNAQYEWAQSPGYENTKNRMKSALFLSTKKPFHKNMFLHLNARQEFSFFNQNFIHANVYDIRLTKNFNRHFEMMAATSKVFRLPTFNDLFWQPGGSPYLKPEKGFRHELGFSFKTLGNNQTFRHQSQIFYGIMNNQLVWTPEGTIWTAKNILHTQNFGLETQTSYQYHWSQNNSMFWQVRTYYTIADEINPGENPWEISKIQQLIYIPMYRYHFGVGINVDRWSVRWYSNYTGYIYTLSDHSQWLEPFWLHHILLGKNFRMNHNHTISCNIYVQNVFNNAYQTMSNRPMPGRTIGIMLNLNYKNHKL